MNWSFLFEIAPNAQLDYRSRWFTNTAAAQFISDKLPSKAKIMSGNDGMIYLLTGRQGMCMMLPSSLWYEERMDEMVEREREMPRIARQHGLEYLFVNRAAKGAFSDDVHKRVLQAFDASPDLRPIFTSGQAVIYQVRSD
jgi:hypothetical protein